MDPMMKKCEKHGIEYPSVGHRYVFCPECQFEGITKLITKEFNDEQVRKEYYDKSCNIEPMYRNATIESFKADTPEQQKAKQAVQNLISTKSGKIVFLGSNGTGKTHLAIAAVRKLAGKILTMYEIGTRIRASYTREFETELDIVDELARLPMLAIDEIGRTKGSEAETNWLSYIIDKRHTRNLPTILISNKHARKTCKSNGCPDCLENYISEDIMSRLREDGVAITFTGPDYRAIKRQEPKEVDHSADELKERIEKARKEFEASYQKERQEILDYWENGTKLTPIDSLRFTDSFEAFMKKKHTIGTPYEASV
jgi:putative replication protein